MSSRKIWIAEPKYVDFNDATLDGTAQTALTITWSLSADIANATPIATGSLTHSSGGDYRGTIAATDTAGLTAGTTYYVHILCSSKIRRTLIATADRRGAT